MTSPSRQKAPHETLAEALKDDAPRMDDLRRARLERRVIARSHGASTSQELAPISAGPAVVRPLAQTRGGRVAIGALALAAAAIIGFVVRGAIGSSGAEAPRFAIGSAFETREGTLTNGARFELASGEEGRLEIGDVTAEVRDGGAVEVRSIDPNDVRLVLDRGTAELAFHPHERGRQHLRIVTPSADVEVVGTIFTVHVDDAGTAVSVREGTVRVTARAGDVVLVHAGESVTVPRATTVAAAPGASAPQADRVGRAAAEAATDPASEELVTAEAAAVATIEATPVGAALPLPLAFRGSSRGSARESFPPTGALQPPVAPVQASAQASSTQASVESSATASVVSSTRVAPQASAAAQPSTPRTAETGGSASELGSPIGPTTEVPSTAELVAVHPRELAVDTWAAHRPSSREIAAAWHDIDELQARGQFERSLALLVRLERYAPASDQDEALFDRARTVQEALRRPRAARALYSEYARRFPEGRHIQEVRRRLVALGAPAEGDPSPATVTQPTEEAQPTEGQQP